VGLSFCQFIFGIGFRGEEYQEEKQIKQAKEGQESRGRQGSSKEELDHNDSYIKYNF